MDKLHITGLECTACIGVHAWEQQIRQRVVIDLVLAIDAAVAAASDELRDALDYSAVARDVRAFVSSSRYQLIEALAEGLCAQVLNAHGVSSAVIRVHKPSAIPAARDTVIEIERRR